jgi:hypothetical protein
VVLWRSDTSERRIVAATASSTTSGSWVFLFTALGGIEDGGNQARDSLMDGCPGDELRSVVLRRKKCLQGFVGGMLD